jgi:alkylhydroperoxidase/carboxymuconolactone decarboxylase family protein YurZ
MTRDTARLNREYFLRRLAEARLSVQAVSGRATLEPRMKSLIALAVLAAQNRPDEFADELASALEAGVSPVEILEILPEMADLGIHVPSRIVHIAEARLTADG